MDPPTDKTYKTALQDRLAALALESVGVLEYLPAEQCASSGIIGTPDCALVGHGLKLLVYIDGTPPEEEIAIGMIGRLIHARERNRETDTEIVLCTGGNVPFHYERTLERFGILVCASNSPGAAAEMVARLLDKNETTGSEQEANLFNHNL